ncbi:hypothetical protein Thiowin_00542 [Thiorhodovibrio winogradskyi]|uniref:GGDEF domain-containing protein n=1 Tax=Thiorhodovibrio winogradskyi TaxID=77007 RepID=A0ABZ0S3A2_9GAMM
MQPGDDSDSLLARVDSALYEAKRNGRNRLVIRATDPAQTPAKHQPNQASGLPDLIVNQLTHPNARHLFRLGIKQVHGASDTRVEAMHGA